MGSSALVALGLLLALQFLIQNEGVESKKHWPNGGGSKVMQRGWGGGLMQKVLYRQDKLRHWLQGMTNYQEETNYRVDEELNTIQSEFQSELRKRKRQTDGKFNTIQSELRKLKRKVNKPPPQRVDDCDNDDEVQTTDLVLDTPGCCKPGLSLVKGECCPPIFLVDDYINSEPIGSGVTRSLNCCEPSGSTVAFLQPFGTALGTFRSSVDGECCELPPNQLTSLPDEDGNVRAMQCCGFDGSPPILSDTFECQSEPLGPTFS